MNRASFSLFSLLIAGLLVSAAPIQAQKSETVALVDQQKTPDAWAGEKQIVIGGGLIGLGFVCICAGGEFADSHRYDSPKRSILPIAMASIMAAFTTIPLGFAILLKGLNNVLMKA